ncbi:hypothetical protein [Streptomyces rubiginosohelvolus]
MPDEPDRATPLEAPVPPPGVIFMTKEPPCELCESSPYRCIEHSEEY